MIRRFTVQSFWANEHGISEEYTSLPALSVVMIGFSLFLVLLAHTYTAYQDRMMQVQYYQIAEGLIGKCTNPDSPFMRNGLVDVSLLSNSSNIMRLRDEYRLSNISFIFRLRYLDVDNDFPEPSPSMTPHRVAAAKELGVYLNDAQTTPGTLTIILWRTT
jgi:hypothetical protein